MTNLQAEESIIDPEGKEEDEGRISYNQVEHVDVGITPEAPFGNEGVHSCSIDKESHDKHQ